VNRQNGRRGIPGRSAAAAYQELKNLSWIRDVVGELVREVTAAGA